MNIDKSQIVELLRSNGDHRKADEADLDLPDTIDTERDGGLLDASASTSATSSRGSAAAASGSSSAEHEPASARVSRRPASSSPATDGSDADG